MTKPAQPAGSPPPPPAEIGWLTQLVGAENVLTLVETYAGTRLAVPLSPARSKLRGLIGPDALAALCSSHGGTQILVPSLKQWRIRVYAHRGLSRSETALRVGLSERAVKAALSPKGWNEKPRHDQMQLPI